MGRPAGRWLAAIAVAVVAGCGTATAGAPETADDGDLAGEVLVFAAASLTDAFGDLATRFEADHPGVDVVLNLAGSQQLATQILEGAPADLFASADQRQAQAVLDAGLADNTVPFAHNRLAIVVEAGNPLRIRSLSDLAAEGVKLVLATEEVPAGRYARAAFTEADLEVSPVSLEVDVRAVVAKVSLGEADAGIVYVSDLASAGDDVTGVGIPDDVNVRATYPAAVLDDAPNPAAARAFLDLLRSAEGQRILAAHGFEPVT